jgi:hypothetical protein
MLIDVGTNGEIVLGNNEWLMCCSCSAGPAFEGCGIEHGMHATAGAIERLEYNPDIDADAAARYLWLWADRCYGDTLEKRRHGSCWENQFELAIAPHQDHG